jgi:integrase
MARCVLVIFPNSLAHVRALPPERVVGSDHGLRHTALTETAAAGVPSMFVQAKAGHAQGSTTERYLHARKTSYPNAAELAEVRLSGAG